MRNLIAKLTVCVFGSLLFIKAAGADPDFWKYEWPNTDFTKTSVNFQEILSGGPPKDGIPAIDNPIFAPVGKISGISKNEPVITVEISGKARAYPLQVLMWHEIVNDELAGIPISVTFCPLCNASIVFDRRLKREGGSDLVLDFGTTGKLRNSDLVMYDRQTESWWQQFTGEAIVGDLTGESLTMIPARIESFNRLKSRFPEAEVLLPNNPNARAYGKNPYVGYDSLDVPFLYRGEYPANVAPLSRVVAVGEHVWSLDYIRKEKRIETQDGIIVEWEKGQNSALDAAIIGEGTDIGNIIAYKMVNNKPIDVVYRVDFAFAYHAFHPDKKIITK
ncbi:DUF3179 domain-containing protein [Sneathiella glossodoripedis]|uniref:DUF3179 domain-containing protein n=1 Tax=Sneathiella glossodoripedis TaxID=418853 RepID=UPI00046E65C0